MFSFLLWVNLAKIVCKDNMFHL